MISLKRIVEQQGSEQLYDLGKDFSNFNRTIDGTSEQIKGKFEQIIGAKLNGKRVKAKASRGYKQFVKTYEFDVAKIALDDYYDNYVIVAYDNSTPKPKEYFLKPGFQIEVLGPATGQPSPQKGNKPGDQEPNPDKTQKKEPNASVANANSQQMIPAPVGKTPGEVPVKEDASKPQYESYSIDNITQDIKPWFPKLLIKPETALRDFIPALGWMTYENGNLIAIYDLKIPVNALNIKLNQQKLKQILDAMNNFSKKDNFTILKAELNETKDEWKVRIKKIEKIN